MGARHYTNIVEVQLSSDVDELQSVLNTAAHPEAWPENPFSRSFTRSCDILTTESAP